MSAFSPADLADPYLFAMDGRAATAFAEATITIDAPVARIWALLVEIESWPQWNPAVQRARMSGPLTPGTVFTWKSGGMAITSTLCECNPMRDLSWTGQALGTRARHAFRLIETTYGVQVTTREAFDGWLPKLMPGTMRKMLLRTLTALLESLRLAAETGR